MEIQIIEVLLHLGGSDEGICLNTQSVADLNASGNFKRSQYLQSVLSDRTYKCIIADHKSRTGLVRPLRHVHRPSQLLFK